SPAGDRPVIWPAISVKLDGAGSQIGGKYSGDKMENAEAYRPRTLQQRQQWRRGTAATTDLRSLAFMASWSTRCGPPSQTPTRMTNAGSHSRSRVILRGTAARAHPHGRSVAFLQRPVGMSAGIR